MLLGDTNVLEDLGEISEVDDETGSHGSLSFYAVTLLAVQLATGTIILGNQGAIPKPTESRNEW